MRLHSLQIAWGRPPGISSVAQATRPTKRERRSFLRPCSHRFLTSLAFCPAARRAKRASRPFHPRYRYRAGARASVRFDPYTLNPVVGQPACLPRGTGWKHCPTTPRRFMVPMHPRSGRGLSMNLLGAPAPRWRAALHEKHPIASETPALPGYFPVTEGSFLKFAAFSFPPAWM